MLESVPNIVEPNSAELAAFLEDAELRKELDQLSAEWGWGALQQIGTRVLKCHPGNRCTFEINLKTERGSHEIVGKAFATARPDAYSSMAEIRQAGFDSDSPFAIPQPLAYVPSLRLLLETKVQGSSVKAILFDAESSGWKHAAVRCAHWLAKFHASAPRLGQITSVDKLISKSRSQCRKLARLGGCFQEMSRLLLAKLEAGAARLGIAEICPAHGEYNPSHVLFENDRTVVIDWDGCQVRDPARDVATFIIVTKWLALNRTGSLTTFDSVADAFLQAYIAQRGPDILERLPFHLAAVCLKHAKYCAAYQFERWREKTTVMLEEGLSAVGLAH